MTGRRAGYCAGYHIPGYANQVPAYGTGFGGRGGGHGWRNWFYATGLPFWARAGAYAPTPENEVAGLKNEANVLREQLEMINRRIEELEKKE
jgi:hypothetical protein